VRARGGDGGHGTGASRTQVRVLCGAGGTKGLTGGPCLSARERERKEERARAAGGLRGKTVGPHWWAACGEERRGGERERERRPWAGCEGEKERKRRGSEWARWAGPKGKKEGKKFICYPNANEFEFEV
jgi:hypothetical protein